ncbi:MAG: PAS domain S-box protein, partial [Gluconacetobacter diazotrophicus]|nr:PAS domain S-box protein [Gluconacetobacter diazotrophicus]
MDMDQEPPGATVGEEDRLARLRALRLVGTGTEAVFDAIAAAAAAVTGMPVAAINLVDARAQWNKAGVGGAPLHMARADSLCAATVAGKRVLSVPDLREDPRFRDLPPACGEAAIRGYCGVPIVLDDRHAVGTLCVASPGVGLPDAERIAALERLATVAAEVMALREQVLGGAERLQRLYDATPAMMHSTDERGRLVAASDLWLSELGFERDAVLGRTAYALLDLELLQDRNESGRDGTGTGGAGKVAARIRDNRGAVREVLMASRGEEDGGGGRRTMTVLEDVSERRRAEAALHAAYDFLQRTGAVAGVGGWELDLRRGTVHWSDEVCRLHGREPGHRPTLAEGLSHYEPEAQPVIEAAVARAVADGESWDLELPMRTASGAAFWARVVGSVERDAHGPVRLVGALQDVSARKRMEQELAESRELLQVTLDSIGDGVVTAGVDGTVTWMNPVAERLTG